MGVDSCLNFHDRETLLPLITNAYIATVSVPTALRRFPLWLTGAMEGVMTSFSGASPSYLASLWVGFTVKLGMVIMMGLRDSCSESPTPYSLFGLCRDRDKRVNGDRYPVLWVQ